MLISLDKDLGKEEGEEDMQGEEDLKRKRKKKKGFHLL